jgi:hypothetical protein
MTLLKHQRCDFVVILDSSNYLHSNNKRTTATATASSSASWNLKLYIKLDEPSPDEKEH